MKNILVIAPTYCRMRCANGQIERHFFHNLPQDEYRVTILCSDQWNDALINDHCILKQTHFNKWVDYACRAMFHTPFSYIGNVPDKDLFSWGKNAIKEAFELANTEKFDLIHSICMPCSSHIVAYEIKKRLHIPWIAQFYDPWSGNPFRILKGRRMQQMDQLMEYMVAKNADLIIHPCDVMIEHWTALYGDVVKNKLTILPFITEIPEKMVREKDADKLIISHIGSFSSNRNASVFIQALTKLDKSVRQRIKVNFVGNVTEEDTKLIIQHKLQNTINLVGRVPEQECYHYYESSDMFLIVDIDCSPNLFYPSKILKYFCYQKPILGITTEQSVVRDELKKTGNYPFCYDDIVGISSFLTKAVEDYPSICINDIHYGERFLKDNVINQYSKLVARLG